MNNFNKKNAIIFTHNLLAENFAKTAHGLLRGTERFNIVAVVDLIHHGNDAGIIFQNTPIGIPVYKSINDFLQHNDIAIDYCIVGVAFPGGQLPIDCREQLLSAMKNNMSIISGLHQLLSDDDEFLSFSKKYNVKLIDIRKPRPTSELNFWSGKIFEINTPIIAVLGTDCAVGKRTMARLLRDECTSQGISSELIYTGQTGWMQGYPFGFILDATPNDFVSGEIERSILECVASKNPDIIFLEGQSSLRNPSGPCGAEFILSANAKNIVLVHPIKRKYFIDLEEHGCKIPNIIDEINLISMYGGSVIGIGVNEEDVFDNDFKLFKRELSKNYNFPIVKPLSEGVEEIINNIKKQILSNGNDI
tara:strand:+ start:688 stop:1773 length:1086 start_codon:yes stop_codon:yes gene_type:complete